MRNSGIVTHEAQAKAYLRATRNRFGLVLALMWLMQGCAPAIYVEVGIGMTNGSPSSWVDTNEGSYASLRAEWAEKGRIAPICQFTHYSQYSAGTPFNNEDESALNHAGCALRFRITK